MARLAPAAHVRHVEVDGSRIVLDLSTASYLTIDRIGSAFWSALTGEDDRDAVLDELGGRFGVGREVLDTDLAAFADRACRAGLLTARADLPSPPRRAPSRGSSNGLYSLAATAYRLRRHGLARTYDRYARFRRGAARQPLDDALDRFHFAENFFVAAKAPQDCLPRSLALFRYLVARGFDARHVIGVRPVPFLAHAWVEVGDRALLGPSGIAFRPIARLHATAAA